MMKKTIIVTLLIITMFLVIVSAITNIYIKDKETKILLNRLKNETLSKKEFYSFEKIFEKNREDTKYNDFSLKSLSMDVNQISKHILLLDKLKKLLEIVISKQKKIVTDMTELKNNEILSLKKRFNSLKKIVQSLAIIVKSNEAFYSEKPINSSNSQNLSATKNGQSVVLEDIAPNSNKPKKNNSIEEK